MAADMGLILDAHKRDADEEPDRRFCIFCLDEHDYSGSPLKKPDWYMWVHHVEDGEEEDNWFCDEHFREFMSEEYTGEIILLSLERLTPVRPSKI